MCTPSFKGSPTSRSSALPEQLTALQLCCGIWPMNQGPAEFAVCVRLSEAQCGPAECGSTSYLCVVVVGARQ